MAARRFRERLFVGSGLLLLTLAGVYLGVREQLDKRRRREAWEALESPPPVVPALTDLRPEADVGAVGS